MADPKDIISKDLVKSIDAVDLVLGSIAKPLVEGLASGVVGNGNLISGVAKMGIAMAAAKYGGSGRVPKALAIGAGMDGAEDLILAIKAKMGGTTAAATSAGAF